MPREIFDERSRKRQRVPRDVLEELEGFPMTAASNPVVKKLEQLKDVLESADLSKDQEVGIEKALKVLLGKSKTGRWHLASLTHVANPIMLLQGAMEDWEKKPYDANSFDDLFEAWDKVLSYLPGTHQRKLRLEKKDFEKQYKEWSKGEEEEEPKGGAGFFKKFLEEEGDNMVFNPDTNRRVKLRSLKGPKGKTLLETRYRGWQHRSKKGSDIPSRLATLARALRQVE